MDEIEFSEIVDGWLCTLVAEPVELAEVFLAAVRSAER